jgi:hypothetical protein
MLTPPPAAVAVTNAPSFRDVGWLLGRPDEAPVQTMLGPGWGPVYATSPAMAATPLDGGASQNPKRGTAAWRVAARQVWSYSDPPELPMGTSIFRRQAIVTKAPQQYGTDEFALGHYAPFKMPRPVGTAPGTPPLLAEMQNSAFQPISRGGHVLVSITESNAEGGPGAAGRRFANTRFGLWFKAWVIGGANVRPLGSVQTPSPQFRGVLPNYGYLTLPQVIGQ